MAYQVISQNNTTTTLADENGNVIRVPARVSLATSTDYTITKVNNSTATLEDGNGNIIRDVPCVAVLVGGEGGGGTVDYSKTVQKTNTMPTASATNAGQVFMYTGATDSNYTQNYIYKNVKTATYTGTVSFEAATLSGTTVACSGDNFANFLTESRVEPLSVVSGTMTYDSASALWRLVGKDSDGNTVLTFQEYQQDFVDAGFTFTGTPQDGDVVAFTCTVEEASATYAWTRIDVQPAPVIPDPLPSQTGNAGKFLTTDGTDASWSDKPLVNTATGTSALTIFGTPTTQEGNINIGRNSVINASSTSINNILIGTNTKLGSGLVSNVANTVLIGTNSQAPVFGGGVAVGCDTYVYDVGLAAGWKAESRATYAIQLGRGANSAANTFSVGLSASNNYRMLDSDGTIPAARHAALPAADGTYTLQLVIADGVPTLSWVAV